MWGQTIHLGRVLTGLNSPTYRATLIADFVFWVGIGHAGTLISAILCLFRAKRRNTILSACAMAFNLLVPLRTMFRLEELIIIISSLVKDFLPGSWGHYQPTLYELGITAGSLGWFFFWFLLFCKSFPIVSMSEIKLIMPKPLSPESKELP